MTTHAPLVAGNARVKAARRLSRRSVRAERRLFLADGPKATGAALATPDRVVEVFATERATAAYAELRDRAARQGVAWTLVEDRAMAGLSDSVTPAGVVAVCRFLEQPLPAALASGDLLVVCADVRDPGNAGTVIRTADAVGADAVVLAGRSVDPYNPKTVRASVGSLFQLPLAVAAEPAEAVRAAQQAGAVVLAADGAGEVDLFDADDLLRGPVAWLFGNEAWGLPAELAGLADHRVAIPITGGAESLNLATAAAVCLYATARARRG
ncbi:TrmH family RNA methyltransferase [Nocardioides coralli]|uniref:TrmH family RNA methyltransferase n=1 Tax=Nocardioides coralli TaxID=2872154 RepID=UPI001CA3E6B0|nr:RNA methyltransferase [Nocardioides coralli]QZY30550.1 RNA methyltransferase [Nocardioides coralli]